MSAKNLVAVVTGANRGIGWQVARELGKLGYRLVLGVRDEKKGRETCDRLEKEGIPAVFSRLDVSDPESIESFARFALAKYGRVDVLVNNAGVFPEDASNGFPSGFDVSSEEVLEAFRTNTCGPLLLSQKLIPQMRKNGYGRVVNVSSGMGQLSEMNGGCASYRLSKTALNAVTRIFAEELKGTGVLVNSVCPGWVKTEMGGPNAERTLEEGARGIVWAATLPETGPTGGFFRDGERLDW